MGMDVIVPFVERLFSLDSSSPTQLRPASASSPEGGLWKATLAAAATLLMYYEERCAARPAQLARLTAQMRDCWSAGPGAAARRAAAASSSSRSSSSSGGGGCYIAHESALEVLLRWSRLITAEFRVANLHLTARTGPGGERGGGSGRDRGLGERVAPRDCPHDARPAPLPRGKAQRAHCRVTPFKCCGRRGRRRGGRCC